MALKKQNFKLIATMFAVIIAIIGLSSFGYDYTSFIAGLIYTVFGLTFILEVGIRYAIKNITKLDFQQYLTITIGLGIGLIGLGSLFGFSIQVLSQFAGVLTLGGVALFLFDLWSKGK